MAKFILNKIGQKNVVGVLSCRVLIIKFFWYGKKYTFS
jgi:hypothetical protein